MTFCHFSSDPYGDVLCWTALWLWIINLVWCFSICDGFQEENPERVKVRTSLTFMFCDLNTWSWFFYCLWGDSCWYVVRLRIVQYQRIVRFVICEEYSDLANVCVKVCKCSDRSGSHILQQLCQSVRSSPLGSQSPSELLCTVMWCSAPVSCQELTLLYFRWWLLLFVLLRKLGSDAAICLNCQASGWTSIFVYWRFTL